jgi:hypothetical protein
MATAILARHHTHQHLYTGPITGDLKMVLTPIQLAALIQGASINPQEIFLNRVWGGAMLIGGAVELVGGVTLLLTPERTSAMEWSEEPATCRTCRKSRLQSYGRPTAEGNISLSPHSRHFRETNNNMSNHRFEYLDSFIGTMFHQDYDIFGKNLEEITDWFKKNAMPNEQQRTLNDVKVYLGEHPDDNELATDFYRTFEWGLVENAFGTPRQFLTKVEALLSTPETQGPETGVN